MVKSVEDRLQEGIYGSKQTKPEERAKYLGTLRERIYLAITKEELQEPAAFIGLEKEIVNHSQAALFINDALPAAILQHCIEISQKNNINFTLVSSESEIGVVYADTKAVHEECIQVFEKYPNLLETKKADEPTKKKSFWQKLFGK